MSVKQETFGGKKAIDLWEGGRECAAGRGGGGSSVSLDNMKKTNKKKNAKKKTETSWSRGTWGVRSPRKKKRMKTDLSRKL